MKSPRDSRQRMAIMAVLQAAILTTLLVLAPAQIIAQTTELDLAHATESDAILQGETEALVEPAVESIPAPGDPEDKKGGSRTRSDGDKPKLAKNAKDPGRGTQPKGEALADAEPDLALYIYPGKLELSIGEVEFLAAWTCDANDAAPFGADEEPGTNDDTCGSANGARWAVKDDAVASLAKDEGKKVRLAAHAATESTKVVAKLGELTARASLVIKATPAQVQIEEPVVQESKDNDNKPANGDKPAQGDKEDKGEGTQARDEAATEAATKESSEESVQIEDPVVEEVQVKEEPNDKSDKPAKGDKDKGNANGNGNKAKDVEPVVEEAPVIEDPIEDQIDDPVIEEVQVEEEPSPEPVVEAESPVRVLAAAEDPAAIEPAAIEIAASAAADLDQCANGSIDGPFTECDPSEWVNGNLNQSKAHYAEDELIPYRLKVTGATIGAHAVTIEWDTTKNGKHALDYIGTYDHTVAGADPCAGISACSSSPDDTEPIPLDSQVTGAGVTPIPGSMALWGGTITGISAITFPAGTGFAGDKKARVTINVNLTQANAVLAWGGHISSRFDWGPDSSAGTITGSPYHMRLIDIDGKGGNQDRSLSAAAVFLPGFITIIKDADPEGDTQFGYTATGGLSPATFTLTDDGSDADRRTFADIFDYSTYTFTEDAAPGWDLDFGDPVCTVLSGTEFGGTQSASGRTVTVKLNEGEVVTCTFRNTAQPATLIVKKVVNNGDGGANFATDFSFLVTGTTDQAETSFAQDGGDLLKGKNKLSVAAGTYSVTEPPVSGYATTYENCDNVSIPNGGSATCTITNDDIAPSLTLTKVVDRGDGGEAQPDDFALTVGGNGVLSGVRNSYPANVALALDETMIDGYQFVSISGDAVCPDALGGTVTLQPGDDISCTITNDDMSASLTLGKTVMGGTATQDDFQASIGDLDVAWDASTRLVPGTYSASEAMNVTDYVAGEWAGDCAADGTVTIALGDELTCTVTNYYAELEIDKSAEPRFFVAAGDEIDYAITATNTGLATLHDVAIEDALIDGLGSWTCSPSAPATLAPGDSITCTATYAITEADIDAGSVPNTACVISDETSEPVCDEEEVLKSELIIVKEANVETYAVAGDQIDYTVTATNAGQADLHNVDISDALIDGLDSWTCSPTLTVDVLTPAESIVCTATYTITKADIDAGSVPNSACAISDETSKVCDDIDIPLAQLEIVKAADPLFYAEVSDQIGYTITATNTGEATLTDVVISDALIDGLGSWTCSIGDTVATLPADELFPGQSIVCTATYSITQADIDAGSVDNIACAISDQTSEVCDEVTVGSVVVDLIKTADPQRLDEPGGTFTYTLSIDNDSVVPVTITSLTDTNSADSPDFAADCGVLVGTVLAADDGSDPGGSDEASCQYTVTHTNAGTYPNTAVVTVENETGTEATDTDDETVRVIDVAPEIAVTKTPSRTHVEAPGADVDFTFVVENLSVEPVTITSLEDDVFSTLDGDADCQVGTVLGVGEACEFTETFFVGGSGGELHANVFTAEAIDDEENDAVDDDDAEVIIQTPIEIFIQKTPDPDVTFSGKKVTFTIDFKHDLPYSVFVYDLVDDVYGNLLAAENQNEDLVSNSCASYYGSELLPGVSYSCELVAVVTGPVGFKHVNVASITVTDVDPVSPTPAGPALQEPNPAEPRFASAEDDATVLIKGHGAIQGQLPPTDMLASTVSATVGGPLSPGIAWALWVLLSTAVILAAGWVIREQRLEEAWFRSK